MSNDDSRQSLIQSQFNHAKNICSRDVPTRPVHSVPSAATIKNAVVVDEDKNPRSTPPAGKARAQVAVSVGHHDVGQKPCGLKPRESKTFKITARFSESEREILVRQAAKSRLTVSEHIRSSALGANYASTIDPVKRQLLLEINRELSRQGNNFNQIAKQLNAGAVSPEQGNSMLAVIARSLLSAHQSVRKTLAEGRRYE